MNLETWAYIHHLFFAERLPKRLIARKLGLDIQTIRRALKKSTFSRGPATPRGSKLDPFKDPIHTGGRSGIFTLLLLRIFW
jgi:hypothetical protein